MSGSEHPIEWYLARDGQQFGPLSDVELRKFVELGHLRQTDLLWRHGFTDWRPASAVFGPSRPGAPAAPQALPQSGQRNPATKERTADAARGRADPGAAAADAAASHTMPQAGRDGAATGAEMPNPQREQRQPSPRGGHRSSPAAAARRRFPWRTVIALVLVVLIAAAALSLHQSGRLAAFMADVGLSDIAHSIMREDTASDSESTTTSSTPAHEQTSTAMLAKGNGLKQRESLMRSPLQGFAASPEEVDASFQKTALWQLLKKEFPVWYGERVSQTAKLKSEQKGDKEIAQSLAEALVALRREHVGEALSASPPRLRFLAASFLDNLGRLANQSTDACYGFISQGETSPLVVELMRSSDHSSHLQAQVMAVFEAIVEGRNAPRAHANPRREDYDALAAQLAKRGWGPEDLKLFSDARALSQAPPKKVCQMVQDWFAAQLAVKDEDVQMRLLVEALKPVVAG